RPSSAASARTSPSGRTRPDVPARAHLPPRSGTKGGCGSPMWNGMLSCRSTLRRERDVTDDDAPGLAHVPDPGVGAWIGERLGQFGATVGGLVPRGYPAYARVLHRLD